MKQPSAFFPGGTDDPFWSYREGDKVFLATDPQRIGYTVLWISYCQAVVLEGEDGEQLTVDANQAREIVPIRLSNRFDLFRQTEASQ